MKMNSKIDMEKITFRNETPADYKAVENLTREAFWNVYKPGCDEHFVAAQLPHPKRLCA